MQTRIHYDDELLAREALQQYFARYHFTNGGYEAKWFTIKVGPLLIPAPNIKARVNAVKIHDLHHVITGYRADLRGEAEIGAWELAVGCGTYWVAWALNAGSFLLGLFLCPMRLYGAFMAGRRCDASLYRGTTYDDRLLDTPLRDLRMRLNAEGHRANTFFDRSLFLIVALFATAPILVVVYVLVR